jgi:hypothetical protein
MMMGTSTNREKHRRTVGTKIIYNAMLPSAAVARSVLISTTNKSQNGSSAFIASWRSFDFRGMVLNV